MVFGLRIVTLLHRHRVFEHRRNDVTISCGLLAVGGRCISVNQRRRDKVTPLGESLLIISPVTRCAATLPLELELKVFLSNNERMSTATEM